MRRPFLSLLVLLAVLAPATALRADDDGTEFFEKKIRPILVQYCYECHSANAKKLGGGLLLDSRDGVRKGGDSGAVLESGKPDESLLIEAVRYGGDAVKMPPKGKLPAAAIADLEEWVKLGAPDPRVAAAAGKANASWEEILRVRRDWWSLHPLSHPVPPQTKTTEVEQPIDRFVLTRLEAQGLAPAKPASDMSSSAD
jgi:hypothetical protein